MSNNTTPIGDPRQAGEEGPAGDQRKAGEAGPAGDPRKAGEAAVKVADVKSEDPKPAAKKTSPKK